MSERARRLSKIADLRAKSVEQAMLAVAHAQKLEARAKTALDEAREHASHSLESIRKLSLAGGSADDWQGTEHWHADRKERERACEGALADESRQVEGKRAALALAQSELEKFKLLLERIKSEDARVERVRSQKAEDEHTSVRMAIAQSRQGPVSE